MSRVNNNEADSEYNQSAPLHGECRCGQIKFQLTSPPLLTMACHCKGCQKMSASAYSLSATIPSESFSVTEGKPVIGGLHGEIPHYFCNHCMSWLFTRIEGVMSFVNIRLSMLDDASPFPPYIETCTDEKLAWAETPAIHSFTQFPAPEEYEGLVKQYLSQENI